MLELLFCSVVPAPVFAVESFDLPLVLVLGLGSNLPSQRGPILCHWLL